ncbi:MAG: glycosyltransferase [Candidatus Eremiobacteraeota bacterium]|nr:glycosyltransferase [Candidatus Eremiobacteraeota bacterium]
MSFVFHDPSGRRWSRFLRILVGLWAAALSLAGLIVAGAFVIPKADRPELPGVSHQPAVARTPLRAAPAVPFRSNVASGSYAAAGEQGAPRRGSPLVWAFYVNWDVKSKVSLVEHLARISHLVPEWLALRDDRGNVADETDESVAQIARNAAVPMIAEINNYRGRWDGPFLHRILRDPRARTRTVDGIARAIAKHRFAGVNVDFEMLQRGDGPNFVLFMRELRKRLHPAGALVTQSLPIDETEFDLRKLAALDDFIVPMLYDEHFSGDVPGPIASQHWFERRLRELTAVVPASKIVAGIGNYGYDWTIGSRAGAAQASFSDVMLSARTSGGRVTWNAAQGNPVLTYRRGNELHEAWFLDAVTGLNQMNAVARSGAAGVAVWRLGSEDPGLWDAVNSGGWPAPNAEQRLSALDSRTFVVHYGRGEILRLAQRPSDGRRSLNVDARGAVRERYDDFPAFYALDHPLPAEPKVVSLTFDDGPSEYTAQILDVLKREGVPATFFVVGKNADRHPELLKRAYDEGHTLGNHTYRHDRNMPHEGARWTELELTATLRTIERATGHGTVLFRPPYDADSEPEMPDELVPIDRADRLGYFTVGERIDPRDWEGGDSIVDDTLAQANDGNIVLLHDGGGDRSATVLALPKIIHALRTRGYRFASIETLMHRSRNELMPVPSPFEGMWAMVESSVLSLQAKTETWLGGLLILAIALSALRTALFGALALRQRSVAQKRTFDAAYRPPVSVVVPAYNEAPVIVQTVRAVLENGYAPLEVIVVDDGSTDETALAIQRAFGDDERVRLAIQPNFGKTTALNHGFGLASNDVVIALDGDTVFRRGTIASLVRHFCDPRVAAVSGNARVGNRRNWLTRFQHIEYVCGFNLERRALDLLGAMTVVPGAVGAWRKSAVLAAGSFSHETLAEDTDLTIALGLRGHLVRYEDAARADTEVPEDPKAFRRQRVRWSFGTLQAAWKYRAAIFTPRSGWLGMLALPSIWVFQLAFVVLSPVAELAMLAAILGGNWSTLALYCCGLFAIEALGALLAFALEGESPRALWLLPLQRIYYRYTMYFVGVKALALAARGRLVGWSKLERRATVVYAEPLLGAPATSSLAEREAAATAR